MYTMELAVERIVSYDGQRSTLLCLFVVNLTRKRIRLIDSQVERWQYSVWIPFFCVATFSIGPSSVTPGPVTKKKGSTE